METTRIQDLAENLSQPRQREHPPQSELPPQAGDAEVSLWEGFIPDPVEPRELGLDGPSVADDSAHPSKPG